MWPLDRAGRIRRINGSLGFCIMAEFTTVPTYSTAILGQVRENLIAPPQSCLRLEKAIAGRSADADAMLNQITDLFLLNVGQYTVEQLDVYDVVLKKLIAKVEVAARAMLARRLALVNKAPPNTIRSLALDDAIEVAEPILSQYNALDDDILTRCIAIKGQEHLLAIATRNKISETISYHLVAKGSKNVLGTLAINPGAAISDSGFGILVEKSVDDDWLSECVAGRKDIPEHHLRELVSTASGSVRQRLMTSNPELSEIIRGMLPLTDIPGEQDTKASDGLRRGRTSHQIATIHPKRLSLNFRGKRSSQYWSPQSHSYPQL